MQGNSELCAPFTALLTMADLRPLAFARMVQRIYWEGTTGLPDLGSARLTGEVWRYFTTHADASRNFAALDDVDVGGDDTIDVAELQKAIESAKVSAADPSLPKASAGPLLHTLIHIPYIHTPTHLMSTPPSPR